MTNNYNDWQHDKQQHNKHIVVVTDDYYDVMATTLDASSTTLPSFERTTSAALPSFKLATST
jgi:hypothetical protein